MSNRLPRRPLSLAATATKNSSSFTSRVHAVLSVGLVFAATHLFKSGDAPAGPQRSAEVRRAAAASGGRTGCVLTLHSAASFGRPLQCRVSAYSQRFELAPNLPSAQVIRLSLWRCALWEGFASAQVCGVGCYRNFQKHNGCEALVVQQDWRHNLRAIYR